MDASSRALLDRAKALANGATDSQMLLNAQDNSVDALKRAMNLLNADDDPLLKPLPPMEPLACEAMLAEARGGSSSKKSAKVPSPVSKPRKARHAPSAPKSDSGTSQRKPPAASTPSSASTPSLVAAPLARVIELSPNHSGAPRPKGADADTSGAAKAAADRVRQRQQEKTEEAEEQARQEAATKEAFNKASQQKGAKLAADAQERVAKAKREVAMKQEAEQQEQQAAQQQKAQSATQEEARLAAAAAAGAKRVAERRSREASAMAKARADEEEQKRLAQQKSDAVAEAAAVAAKKRVAVQKRAARQQKHERDAKEASEQHKRQDRIHDALAAQEEARRLDMAEQVARRKQTKQTKQTSAAVPPLPKHTLQQISPQPIQTARSAVSSIGGSTARSIRKSPSKAPSKSPTRVTQPASKSTRQAPRRQSVHQSFMEDEDAKVVQHDSGDGYAITVDVSATPFRFAEEDAPHDAYINSPASDSSYSPGGSTRLRGVRRVAPWSQQQPAFKQPEAAYSPEAAKIEREFVSSLNNRSEELYDEPLEMAPREQQRTHRALQICTEAAVAQLGGDPSPGQAMRRCSDAVVSSPGGMSSPGSPSDCNLASLTASRRVTSRASRRSYVAELSPGARKVKQPSTSYHCGIAPPSTGSTAASTDTAKEVQRRKRRSRQPPWKNRDPIQVAPLEHYRAKLGDIQATEPSPRGHEELHIKSPLVGLLGSRSIERHGAHGGQRSGSRESRRHLNSRSHALGERQVKSSGDSCMDLLEERSQRVSNKARSRAMEVERQQQQHHSEFYN